MDHQAGADSGILQERAQRLRDVSQGMSVRRAFPLLVEIAVPDDLLAMLRRVTALYILASLRCAQPARVFDLDLLNVHGEDILRLPNRTPNGKLIAKREIALEFNLVKIAWSSSFAVSTWKLTSTSSSSRSMCASRTASQTCT